MLSLPVPWRQPPPLGALIDWSHPLARGLVAFVDATGDHANGRPLTTFGAAALRSDGHIVTPGGSSDGASVPFAPGLLACGSDLTAISFCAVSSMMSWGHLLSVPYRLASWTSPYVAIGFAHYETSGRLALSIGNASGNVTILSDDGFIASDGHMACRAVAKSATAVLWYKDNIVSSAYSFEKGSSLDTAPDCGARHPLSIGNHSSTSPGEAIGGVFGPQLIYSRMLSASELAAINADPYRLFRPMRRYWSLADTVPCARLHLSGLAPDFRRAVSSEMLGIHGLSIACDVSGSHRLPVLLDTGGRYLSPGYHRDVVGGHSLPGVVFASHVGGHRLPRIVGRDVSGRQALLSYTPVGRDMIGKYLQSLSTTAMGVQTFSGSDAIVGLSLSGDRESFAWTCDLTLADEDAYAAFSPGTRLTLSIGGQPVIILVESRTRKQQSGTTEYTATGRTLSCLLDTPWSDPVTKTWGQIAAKEAAAELCALAGLAVSWECCDWIIPPGRLAATAETPASILARLATACGGMVQPTLAGGVRVRYRYPVGVNELADAVPTCTVSLSETVITVSESYDGQPGYDAVTVADDRAASSAYLAMEADETRNLGRSTFPPGEACYLRIYHETAYTMRATSGRLEKMAEDLTESLTATAAFDDVDTADLEKLVASMEKVTWYGNDLGELLPNGGTQIILASGAGFGVAQVAYSTRYDLWRYIPADLGDDFSAQIECAPADASLPADLSGGGMRLTVQRGQASNPCPDELSAELACSLAPATQAGRNYLDEYGQDVLTVELESWPADGDILPMPGDVVAVDDPEEGIWQATGTGLALSVAVQDGGACLTTMTTTVERPEL